MIENKAMKNRYLLFGCLCILSGFLPSGCRPASSSTEKNMEKLTWEKLPDLPGAPASLSLAEATSSNLPVSLGVSAPFTGLHKGKLWVAGGCNFPDKPVTEGGGKRYYADVFNLDLAAPVAWQWVGRLPYPAAYGATVSIPSGVICIGGNNSDSSLVRVARLSWNETAGVLETALLPALPAPMDNLSAAADGNKVYVAGGNQNGYPAQTFLCLDLDQPEKGWEKLPDFPGPARVQPALAVQQSSEGTRIYLAGGFQPIREGKAPVIPTDLLAYDPMTRIWTKEADLPPVENRAVTESGTLASALRSVSSRTLTGGSLVAEADRYLVLAGGVNYDCFLAAIDRPRQMEEAETAGNKDRLDSLQAEAKAYMYHPVEWYRFNRSLLRYDTFAKTWENLGDYEQVARAGAGAVCEGNMLIIVNGELKPGIRTPEVNRVRLP